jgi:hypothetical protein
VVHVLIHGWTDYEDPRFPFPLATEDDPRYLECWDLNDEQYRDLWRRFEREIRAEARRRGATRISAEERSDTNLPPWLREGSDAARRQLKGR